ncbi:hypothetical protein [Desertimonas flava]|uniref:hypothetical protein n=1 Tax=Desertimonas flava TaxID=2064846 RepID=UPI000E3468D5|nr:hypothetical protein [Desertimonas flava]
MDPDAAIRLMHDTDHDPENSRAAAEGLLDWLRRDGFPPAGMTADQASIDAGQVLAELGMPA